MMSRKTIQAALAFAVTAQLVAPVWGQSAAATAAPQAASAESNRRWTAGRGPNRGFGFLATLRKAVGLTPEQQDAVRGLLAEQREEQAALRGKTDAKIRAILTADQQKKFDAFLAELKAQRSPSSTRS